MSQARAVLRHSPDLALAVRSGTRKLDDALEEATKAQERKESDEEKLARLIAKAPDLAELVREERLKLVAGLTEHNELQGSFLHLSMRLVTCPQSAHVSRQESDLARARGGRRAAKIALYASAGGSAEPLPRRSLPNSLHSPSSASDSSARIII